MLFELARRPRKLFDFAREPLRIARRKFGDADGGCVQKRGVEVRVFVPVASVGTA